MEGINRMINFKKNFISFFKYRKIVNKRGVEYSGLQVTIATSFIFGLLRFEWETNYWDVRELKYLCLAMDSSPDELNSSNFINCQPAYLYELKNYYQQNHGLIFVI